MRVLIVTGIYPPSIGGPATHAKIIEENLPSYGIETELLSFDSVRNRPKFIRHILFCFKIFSFRNKIDLIYVLDPVSVGLPTLIVSRLISKKYILRVAGDYAWEQGVSRFGINKNLDEFLSMNNHDLPLMVKILKKIQFYVAKKSISIIVPSLYLKKIVVNWGIGHDKISVIYNSFDAKNHITIDKKKIREKLDMSGTVIMSAGRLVSWKGFDVLIKIFGNKNDKNINLLIIGSGPQKNYLQDIINNNKFLNVKIIDSVDKDKILLYLNGSDIFILNSQYEGFSHQILEAMSCGIPIVASSVGGNSELINDGKNGILVEYNSVSEIKISVNKLISDKKFTGDMINEARKTASFFSVSRMVSGIANLFLNIKK